VPLNIENILDYMRVFELFAFMLAGFEAGVYTALSSNLIECYSKTTICLQTAETGELGPGACARTRLPVPEHGCLF